MSALTQLQNLLRDLFQLDMADLDFGLYRLLRLKREEVEAFLNEQLPRRVEEAFKSIAGEEQEALQKEVSSLSDRIRKEVSEDAILSNGDISPQYQDIKAKAVQELLHQYQVARQKLQSVQASEAQMAEVFNHLYSFFSRYYDSGDFIPRRRYGANETYAVPYRGEEVFFHWANRDQHYVKTAENFRDYSFTVETLSGPSRVRFALTEASVPPGNLKGDTRYFFPLPDEAAWDKDSQTLRLPFHYRLPIEKEVEKYGKNSRFQEAILQEAAPKILRAIPDANTRAALSTSVDQKEDQEVSLLLKRLRHFCRRNTSDYFVHKDLEGFLKRELEFYIKDQVLHLGDLEGDLEAKRRTVRVFRQLAEEMITFLAQIENVQTRLFEKRKFVLRTDYLVPIKQVPPDLWREVLSNKEQLQAWKELFAIEPRQNKSRKVNEEFLKEQPTLVVNTAYFNGDLKQRLLDSFADLDEATDGLLIHGENYHALRLLERKYASKLGCIYIDPPFNTGGTGFLYKNGYRHSSWICTMLDVSLLMRRLLSGNGVFIVAVDDFEVANLTQSLDSLFGEKNRLDILAIETKPSGRTNDFFLASCHEYAMFYCLDPSRVDICFFDLPEGQKADYKEEDEESKFKWRDFLRTGGYSTPEERPNSFYPIYYNPKSGWIGLEKRTGAVEILPLDSSSNKRVWRKTPPSFLGHLAKGDIRVKRGDNDDWKVYLKDRIKSGVRPKSVWTGSKYDASSHGTKLLTNILGRRAEFSYPKSLYTVLDCIRLVVGEDEESTVLDFFGGSGTTGHAIMDLNREDGGGRKFMLVEMADYFDTVLLPRIQKIMYTPDWKDGKPARMPTKDEIEGTPRLVKVLRLEGYDDALHNLVTEETLKQEEPRAKAHRKTFGADEYRLRYLVRLPLEASATMLNVEALEHPFDYKIEVLTENGPRIETVDLIETFNLLYGLHVERLERWVNNGDNRTYKAVKARKASGERALVLWRDMSGLDPVVERRFLEEKLKAEDPFDEVLINGDSATPGVKSLDGLFKRLLEEEER